MAIFAIGDPHLSRAQPKPMDIFGPGWADHPQRLFAGWQATVSAADTVLVPGDISWAMTLDEARPDLEDIDRLPGRKVLVQGNHDYWWQSISRLRQLPLPTIRFIQNDHVVIEDVAICGSRGWILPGDRQWPDDPEHNAKILAREVARLGLSLESARRSGAEQILVMLHYPPLLAAGEPSPFTTLLSSTPGVRLCLFGHMHGPDASVRAPQGEMDGVSYQLVAGDALDFVPARIWPR